jgi:hypothetical protein
MPRLAHDLRVGHALKVELDDLGFVRLPAADLLHGPARRHPAPLIAQRHQVAADGARLALRQAAEVLLREHPVLFHHFFTDAEQPQPTLPDRSEAPQHLEILEAVVDRDHRRHLLSSPPAACRSARRCRPQ